MDADAPTPCAALTRQLLAAAPPNERLLLDLPACRVRIRGNDPGVMSALRAYYREHALASASGDADLEILALAGPTPALPWPLELRDRTNRPQHEGYRDLADGRVVHKLRTGVVLIMSAAAEVVCGPLADHVDQVINFIHHRVMTRWIAGGGRLTHAAGIARGDRGLVLCGVPGAGKSTLALEVMTRDPEVAFITNDRAVVTADEGGPRLCGIPKHPRVNPGTILHNAALTPLLSADERARYLALDGAALRDHEDKRDAVIDRLFGPGRVRLEAAAAAVAVLCWRPDADEAMTIEAVDFAARPDLQRVLHKRLRLYFWPQPTPADDEAMAALVDRLSGVPVYELRGRVDFAAAAAWASELLRGDAR
ncbi:MAG: HprK-related kinase B [Myxococcales bacterium]|nr:HprK-related kinase B [Myxococcales bacterium]